MNMPNEVKQRIAVLNSYTWDNAMRTFNIFHLYPKGLAYPDGLYDSQWFECIGFNTTSMTKKNLGKHDQMNFEGKKPMFVRVYADGSFLISFNEAINVMSGQEITVGVAEEME